MLARNLSSSAPIKSNANLTAALVTYLQLRRLSGSIGSIWLADSSLCHSQASNLCVTLSRSQRVQTATCESRRSHPRRASICDQTSRATGDNWPPPTRAAAPPSSPSSPSQTEQPLPASSGGDGGSREQVARIINGRLQNGGRGSPLAERDRLFFSRSISLLCWLTGC